MRAAAVCVLVVFGVGAASCRRESLAGIRGQESPPPSSVPLKQNAKPSPPSHEQLKAARRERLAKLFRDRAGASDVDTEFDQNTVPVGLNVEELKTIYSCTVTIGGLKREFALLNFEPIIKSVFPLAGNTYLAVKVNGLGYQFLDKALFKTALSHCGTPAGQHAYALFVSKASGAVLAIQKILELKGASEEAFRAANESLRSKCREGMSETIEGSWVVDHAKMRYAAFCDEGPVRTFISTNPVYPSAVFITYIDRVGWDDLMAAASTDAVNSAEDVATLGGRI